MSCQLQTYTASQVLAASTLHYSCRAETAGPGVFSVASLLLVARIMPNHQHVPSRNRFQPNGGTAGLESGRAQGSTPSAHQCEFATRQVLYQICTRHQQIYVTRQITRPKFGSSITRAANPRPAFRDHSERYDFSCSNMTPWIREASLSVNCMLYNAVSSWPCVDWLQERAAWHLGSRRTRSQERLTRVRPGMIHGQFSLGWSIDDAAGLAVKPLEEDLG